jgi:hypothetical protein
MNYRGGAYDAEEENPYAVGGQAQGAPFRRGSYGGSMAANFQREMAPPPVRMVGWQAGEETGERQARIQQDIQVAGENTVQPVREGFRATRDGQDAFAGEGEATAKAMGNLGNQALKSQANYIDAFQQQQSWMMREARNIQATNEQTADSRKKKGGGLLGAIGGIAGSLIGGPIGGIVGAASSLFG